MSRRADRIDELMEQATAAMARTAYFDAERVVQQAVEYAHAAKDFERLARALLPLQEARRQRVQQALDTETVHIVSEEVTEESPVTPGCHLVQPPMVGADARRLRLLALRRDVPVIVVCREPMTQLRLWPVVAICPGLTVRTQVDPPADPESPQPGWFIEALTELGDWAIRSVDTSMPATRRIEAMVLRLDAVPEHERLHQVLADICREAAAEETEGKPARSSRVES